MMWHRGSSVWMITFFVFAFIGPIAAAERGVELRALKKIYMAPDDMPGVEDAARVIQKKIEVLYKLKLDIVKGKPGQAEGAVIVGRRAAIQSGLITLQELDAVKHDGYVLKGANNRVVLAGYAQQGTIYAAWRLMKHLGLKVYPWYFGSDSSSVEVFDPVPEGRVAPFSFAGKPFFQHRDIKSGLDRGRWGGTFRQYSLGDPSQAANQDLFGRDGRTRKKGYTKYKFKRGDWTDWAHTAAYLVPRDLYYETHPEYFAIKNGKRIPPSRYARSQICTTHPDVIRISTERALEWMDIQKDRRFFCVIPADAALCQCPRCLKSDPMPFYCTDRALKWVNTIAAAARARHPDKIILTGAYIGTVKPPVSVKPESNVVILYAPWFWNSRATSDVTFANPLNITAMKELTAWVMRFPGQLGIYDYPGGCARGTADRIKQYASLGVRTIYLNGPRNGRLHWLSSNLVWDPYLDSEKLEAEFIGAFYGPASGPMGEYQRLRRETIRKHALHSRSFFTRRRVLPGAAGPEYFEKAGQLLNRAAQLAEKADLKTQTRILGDVSSGMFTVLMGTHPTAGNLAARTDVQTYKKNLAEYLNLSKRFYANCERLKLATLIKQRRRGFDRGLVSLGLKMPKADAKKSRAEREELFDRTIANIDDMVAESITADAAAEPSKPKAISVNFDKAGEAARWLSDGTQKNLISAAEMITIGTPAGEQMRGVRIKAPLSKLPVIPKGNIKIHAGRFYAERTFEKPVDVTGCFVFYAHIHASCDVPVTIYVDKLHSDFNLHAGEQIVRIDLRNFASSSKFDWKKWRQIKRIGLDIWPQDNYYPFPEAEDTSVTVLGIKAGNQRPAPGSLPHQGKAVWLSQFRSNVPHGISVPKNLYDKLMQRQAYKHPGLDYNAKHLREAFRTFTEHRAVSPIYAILTGANAEAVELDAARELQRHLEKLTGLKLPINPAGLAAGPDVGNAILLGDAALAAKRVTRLELDYVGSEGFVINAHQGRIAIAGRNARSTAYGVARYMEDHGVLFPAPGIMATRDLTRGMLHELYLPDRPFFKNRTIAGGWRLMTQSKPATVVKTESVDVAAIERIAESIKDAARSGRREVARDVLKSAEASACTRYVAARLLWDPMRDTTKLIREFSEGVGKTKR